MGYALRSVGLGFSDGHVLEEHSHPWGQMIYAVSGTMHVLAADRMWLVPPGRALWAPPHMRHEITMRGPVEMRTIYVAPSRAGGLAGTCRAVEITPLLRELILHIVEIGMLSDTVPEQDRLAHVFIDLFAACETLPLALPMPKDARALALAETLRGDPARDDGIEELAREAGASARTLQRIFLEETKLRFVEWRQRLRLLQAVTLLGQGASVTEAGASAGFSSTSAFIAAFRAQMGHTPSRYKRG